MKRFRLEVAARVVAHGFLLLALVAASILFVDRMVLRPAMRDRAEQRIPWFAARAAEHRENRTRLAQEFQDTHQMLRLEISLYDQAGVLMATTVTLPLPSAAMQQGLAPGRMAWIGADLAAVPLFARGLSDGYVVMHNAPPPIPLDFAVKLLILAIVVVAIASVPLTRSLLRTLRELARATRAYSAGDTYARVQLQRNDEFGDLALAFNHMVDHVEALRRSEKQLLANVSHELQQLVDRWSARLRSQAPERKLLIECAAPLPRLCCDAVLLRRAVDNLLDNAVRYSLATAPIALHLGVYGDKLRIVVVDHGGGITAQDLARVFEPFYRVEQSRDRRSGGMGLGLSLAKRIVEAHGGSLTLYSEQHSGTQAIVEMPLLAAAQTKLPPLS